MNPDPLNGYQRFRPLSKVLHERLLNLVGIATMKQRAKELGLFRQGTLIFGSEQESNVLADYCIHFAEGPSAPIARLMRSGAYGPGSDAWALLEAMQQAYYSAFIVDATDQRGMIRVRDVLTEVPLLVVDQGLSVSAVPRLVFASNLVPIPGSDACMTTGAMLPMNLGSDRDRRELTSILERFHKLMVEEGPLSRRRQYLFARQLIRALLRQQAADFIEPAY